MSQKVRWLFLAVIAVFACGRTTSTLLTAASYAGTPYSGTFPSRFPEPSKPSGSTTAAKASPITTRLPGNSGGAFRSTNVDLEPSSERRYNIGWTRPASGSTTP